MTATGTWAPGDASLGAFLAERDGELTRILAGIRGLCAFGPVFTAVVGELGYFRDHEITAPSLLLWSGGVEGVRPDLAHPTAVRRMCRTGADLRLTEFLQALITAALVAKTDTTPGARELADILTLATDLVDGTGHCTPATAFRAWRLRCLIPVLRPDSGAPESGKAGFRADERALDAVIL
ncbi:hypothetical protein [Streptomyces sp. NPDC003635]